MECFKIDLDLDYEGLNLGGGHRAFMRCYLPSNFNEFSTGRKRPAVIVCPGGAYKMPSDQDIEKIKKSTACSFGMFAYFALYTGLRKGELLALTWEDIDLKSRTICVNKSIYNDHNTPKIKKPKTENGIREVPLLNRLYEKLTPGKGIVFSVNGKHMTESQYGDYWERYCKESGVQCTVHQLRHAFTTMLFENDIEIKDAQKILGHAQASTTQDIYTEIRKSRESIIKEKLLSVDINV